VIAAGDSGQLPSVAAGGWFASLPESLRGPELRDVIRQRDPAEREALEALHDGDPDPYLQLKTDQGALQIHEREADAIDAALADWNAAQKQYGAGQAIMITRDNATREILNRRARELLVRDGEIGAHGVRVSEREFSVGDRVITRRNDRLRDVDNGTKGRIDDIDPRSGSITVTTDAGGRRTLDASYVRDHLEHAYTLTGHNAHGSTVEWAVVIGRPSEFTREWAYTALSRARQSTQLRLISELTARQQERAEYAPPEPERSLSEALEVTASSMLRRDAEILAMHHAQPSQSGCRGPESIEHRGIPREPSSRMVRAARGRDRGVGL
jgi:ATP-dependent exoDNAse (exonuclease V) alpha subunit